MKGLALGAIVTIVVAIAAWHWWSNQVPKDVNALIQKAEVKARSASPKECQKYRLLRGIAAARSAQISGDNSQLVNATEELTQLLSKPSSTPAVTYNQPMFVLHISAVAVPKPDGSGQEWANDMYFVGKWVVAPAQPDANGQVKLPWEAVLPVLCLADQTFGPYPTNCELCPKAKEVGMKLPKETGCDSF